MTLRIGSLCTGYGGLDMAVESVLGGELAWVADNDPGACKILAHRFPSVPNLGDITGTDWAAVEHVDVLTAGFPCQDVSCAGGRAGLREGNRTGVWAYVARAIDALRPSLVLLENVGGLLSARADSDMELCPWCLGNRDPESAMRALGAVLGDLAEIGFDAEWCCLRASDAAAPHRRERVFVATWPAADTAAAGEGWRLVAGVGVGRDAPIWHEAGAEPCDGGGAPAADALGGELQRWGIAGVVGSAAAGEPREGHQRQRPGNAAADRGPVAANAHGAAGGERRESAPGQAESGRPRADAGGRGGAPVADPERDGWPGGHPGDAGKPDAPRPGSWPTPAGLGASPAAVDREVSIEWGPYAHAIARWERILGRPAPRPTEPGRTGERLSPRFVEWMQGVPDGWVTDVPGLTRNDKLKALGNGVVPQQGAAAFRLLLPALSERAA